MCSTYHKTKSANLAIWLIISIMVMAGNALAQSTEIQVPAATIGYGGKVQIQKEGERTFKRIVKQKNLVEDGDIIKTGFKSYVIIRVDKSSKFIIGSNARGLIEFLPLGEGGYVTKVTIFQGAMYFAWTGESDINVFTSNGLASINKGTFITSYDGKESKTIDIALKQKLLVQNIAKKENISIPPKNYIIIDRDENPSKPSPVNVKIADIMRESFGDNFINKELDNAGIDLQAKVAQKAQAETETKTEKNLNETPFRISPLFKMDELMAKIRESEGSGKGHFQQPYWIDDLADYKVYFEIKAGMATVTQNDQSGSYTGFKLRAGMRFGKMALCFNIPFETGSEGAIRINTFTGSTGILDKIYFLDYVNAKQTMSIHFGEIRNLSYHRGNMLRDFSNELKSQIEQPLGLHFIWTPSTFLRLESFVADVADFNLIGANILYDNGWTILGAAVVYDLHQGGALTYGDSAYRSPALPVSADFQTYTGTIYGWEPFAEFNFIQDRDLNIFGYAGGSFIFNSDELEGFVFQLPGLSFIYRKLSIFLEGSAVSGKAHPGYFNEFYMEDRMRLNKTAQLRGTYSQSDRHPPMDISKGFRTGLEWQLQDNLWFGFAFGQNFAKIKPDTSTDSGIVYTDTSRALDQVNIDRNIKIRLFGGNNLIEGLKRFEAYYQLQGGQFDRKIREVPLDTIKYGNLTNEMSASSYISLNTGFGVLLEYGILSNATILGQYRAFSLDHNGNGIYDAGELISEFSLTWRMKF